MNMFKKSKKVKDHDDDLVALSSEPSMSKASRALTRKKKKQQQEIEVRPVFDLSSALPDTNEFRTSLLMPNLSARFSMLREQDDPNTKVGKASDDSVLFPKRSSRMNLFNGNALGDIAEVESIRSGFRPPFADENQGFLSDGYASDDGGSVMSRARPGEGNNLFGGRQKLYKVATSSAKDLSSTTLSSRKHVYDSDVSLSAFQQHRLREKDQPREADDGTDRNSYPVTDHDERDSTRSPLTGFSQNRGTQSSTNSGPSNRRTSTAATSVISESPLPQGTNYAIAKVKEQDANSSAESIGFATSPGLRSLTSEDSRPPYRLSGTRSVTNIRENYTRQSPVPTFRAMSPPMNAMAQLDFGLKEKKSPISPPKPRTISPTAQFDFGQSSQLANNVKPNDRGKATAMGLFNKPARHYDDAQFQQRQMQMHEGRNSPSSVNSRAASRASPEPAASGHRSYSSAHGVTSHEDRYTPQIPPIPDYPPSPASNRRTSASSAGRRSESRPRAKSTASVREAVVKARVESLIRKQNAELADREANELGPPRADSIDQGVPDVEDKGHSGTFYDNSDYSDEEEQHPQSRPAFAAPPPRMPPPPPPPSDIHPALRSEISTFNFGDVDQDVSYSRRSHHSTASKPGASTEPSRRSQHESVLSVESNDPRSVPAAGLGLSGLIRTHLRHDSDKSSMMPPPSPMLHDFDGFRGSVSSTGKTVTESVKSDPFEYDNERMDHVVPTQEVEEPPTPTVIMSQRAQQILEQAKAIRDAQVAEASHLKVEPPTPIRSTYDLEISGHQRNESTETQREQRRFEEDLAERRLRVQEGLKSVQERSRSRSPIAERTPITGHGFSLPRFPGRSNTGDRDEPTAQNKAMRMLGISGPREHVTSPRVRQDARHHEQELVQEYRPYQGHPSPLPNEYDGHNGRHTPNSARPPYRNGDRPTPPRSTTPSSRRDNRNRSNSAAADRSVSRNKHVPEFTPRSIPGAFPHTPNVGSPPVTSSQRSESPAMYDRSASRTEQNERSGYFNSRGLAPPPELIQSFTPRPSPKPFNSADSAFTLQSAMPMSPPSSALPSPNPAVNGRTTPTTIPGRATPSGSRKKSVTKHMISEPTFVSSTSTVPLVHLPKDGGPPVEAVIPPPVPAMNPRRRGTAPEEHFAPHPAVRPGAITPAESPRTFDFSNSSQSLIQPRSPRQRNKLRKSSSEGGSIAARARYQALAVEMAREKDKSPNVAVFPNRSDTSLAQQEGGMF